VAFEVRMPQLGLTMEEGQVVRWMVAVGDQVHRGQPLAEIQTDKITAEIESPGEGFVRHILIKEGDSCAVAGLVAVITAPDEDYSPTQAQEVHPSTDPAGPIPAGPEAGASAADAGKHRASPNARRLARERGIGLEGIATGSGAAGRIVGSDLKGQPERSRAKVTPLARRMASAGGVELDHLTGSGMGGRITREDIERSQAASGPPALEVIPLTGVRGVIATRMAESAHNAAAVTLTTEADATELAGLRGLLSSEITGAKTDRIPYDAILVKLVSAALREHSNLNALLVGSEIRVIQDVNIAIAVDTPRGLLSPVVKHADAKNILEIADELAALVDRARSGRSQPDDLEGGTFTITNLGMHEIDAFTPIISPPQCAVLGVGRICPRAVVKGDSLVVRQTVWLSLTFDHRIVDGAPAARFLQRIKQFVERPEGDVGLSGKAGA
jgi:pyruvate dehydrogenase E2 component (dihydrolipoamide acetyltransferase)